MLTGALDHVSVRLKLRNDGGGERDPGGMQLGERERLVACVAQLADLELATHLVTVYPPQSSDRGKRSTQVRVGLWFVVNSGHVLVLVDASRLAIREPR